MPPGLITDPSLQQGRQITGTPYITGVWTVEYIAKDARQAVTEAHFDINVPSSIPFFMSDDRSDCRLHSALSGAGSQLEGDRDDLTIPSPYGRSSHTGRLELRGAFLMFPDIPGWPDLDSLCFFVRITSSSDPGARRSAMDAQLYVLEAHAFGPDPTLEPTPTAPDRITADIPVCFDCQGRMWQSEDDAIRLGSSLGLIPHIFVRGMHEFEWGTWSDDVHTETKPYVAVGW